MLKSSTRVLFMESVQLRLLILIDWIQKGRTYKIKQITAEKLFKPELAPNNYEYSLQLQTIATTNPLKHLQVTKLLTKLFK